jgi:hypothetical protein
LDRELGSAISLDREVRLPEIDDQDSVESLVRSMLAIQVAVGGHFA